MIEQTKKILGINIHYQYYFEHSSKPSVILIHGFLSSSFSFRKLIPLLMNHFNIISIDLPPFGLTEKSPSFVHSYRNMSNVVIQLLEKLNIRRAIFIGHSMGGQIALYTAKYRPQLVDRLVLLCSSSYMKRARSSLTIGSRIPYFHIIIKRVLAKQGVLNNLRNVIYDHSLIDDEMINGYLQPFYDHNIFIALQRMIRDREGDLQEEELKKITIPSLLIWGENDKVVPVDVGKRLQKDLPCSKLITVKRTGHLLPEEKPDLVYTKIMDFVVK
ncbi:alpha/beta hydrolase [Bacillus carboniphilus]|uniref:Alpha/beta hydrolase n=1 Tax=Bacillus carboniphilus TaxID=86663 RepID=A0ABY9JRY7_9BACI|nr:alpha/beta hydrolase [Bacillus carboniphilus]WLR41248.1 alpha/beta hydrolase [Bacillus carboniphilus]